MRNTLGVSRDIDKVTLGVSRGAGLRGPERRGGGAAEAGSAKKRSAKVGRKVFTGVWREDTGGGEAELGVGDKARARNRMVLQDGRVERRLKHVTWGGAGGPRGRNTLGGHGRTMLGKV